LHIDQNQGLHGGSLGGNSTTIKLIALVKALGLE
jgi:hypothetical protein